MTANLHAGEFGWDGNHEFEVVNDPLGAMVEIEYTSDGRRARFQSNRFERRNGELRLN